MRSDYPGNVFSTTHHDEFKLPQVVVGRGFECRTDNSFQKLVADLAVGEIAVCAAFFQYFIEFHMQLIYKSDFLSLIATKIRCIVVVSLSCFVE